MFKGSYVALITPMHDSGEVDYLALKKLVEFHKENGSDGLVAVGTTGESATLPVEEHVAVVQKIVEYSDDAFPVIAGSGANSTEEAILLTRELEKTGVAGFLSVVPYYNKPQQRGMVAHFKAIADATELPILLYNVPGRTVADMLPATVAELAQVPNIIGIKDATGDLERLAETQRCVPADFILLSGDDATSCEFLCRGGHGVISVTANIVPAQMAALCQAALAGNHAEARKIDQSIAVLHHTLFLESNPVMPKWALYKMGLTASAKLRLPLVEPELLSQKELETAMRQAGVLS